MKQIFDMIPNDKVLPLESHVLRISLALELISDHRSQILYDVSN